jgi:hypothetical protein
MKRKTFILTVLAAGAVTAVPLVKCRHVPLLKGGMLSHPRTLALFCDAETIRGIGRSYISQVPGENKKEVLEELLMSKEGYSPDDIAGGGNSVSELIAWKTERDFKEGKIVIENGWVLSETEARQCALFSLDEK